MFKNLIAAPGLVAERPVVRTAWSATVLSPAARSVLTLIVPGTGDPEVTCSEGRVTVRVPGGPVSLPLSLDR